LDSIKFPLPYRGRRAALDDLRLVNHNLFGVGISKPRDLSASMKPIAAKRSTLGGGRKKLRNPQAANQNFTEGELMKLWFACFRARHSDLLDDGLSDPEAD
jgi:hypothetical protein